jgi:hypothetical protein
MTRGAEGANPALASPDETLRQKGPCCLFLWKVPCGMTFRMGHRWGNPWAEACSLRRHPVSRPTPQENLSGL